MKESSQDTDNKRIAKNTLLLYARMLLLMVVSLYTARVTLEALGVKDYGIYDVVGGVVMMFTVLTGSLSSAIGRFLMYELGKGDKRQLAVIFSTSVNIQIGLSVIVALLAEAGGIWFINERMNIPPDRVAAAHWVLQFSILTFVINLISIPYNAAIIAHEKMSAFAYISVLEAGLKLLVVFLLFMDFQDRLIVYAVLLCIVALLIRLVYGIYCKRCFEECTYRMVYDKSLLRRMSSFAGWNFIGSSSAVLREQGVKIAINVFCGPVVNTARSLAFQIQNTVHLFVVNFLTALRPQITKSYAQGNMEYMHSLLFYGSKLGFLMMWLLTLPILLEAPTMLGIWLKTVPEHTVAFVRLTLLFVLFESLSEPLAAGQHATGNIKWYQIIVGGLQSLNFPLAFLLLWMGLEAESTVVLAIVIGQLCLFARLTVMRGSIGLNIIKFLWEVYTRVLVVAVVSCIVPYIVQAMMPEGVARMLSVATVSMLSVLLAAFFLGFSRQERAVAMSKGRAFVEKITRRK